MKLQSIPRSSNLLVTSKGWSGKNTHHPQRSAILNTFVGVDGEGITIGGRHKYVLLGVGDEQIEDSDGLQWRDAFGFLYQQYKPGTTYAGFYLGYDFNQMLKTMPEERVRKLLIKEERAKRENTIPGAAPHPVECDGWLFDLLPPARRLRIKPKNCECPNPTCYSGKNPKYPKCKAPKLPWMYINDSGPFFQASFLTTIDPKQWPEDTRVVTDEEWEIIKEGKEKRSDATCIDDDMKRYNALENTVLARLLSRMDEGFHDIGIHLTPKQWFGPGQAAQAWQKNEKEIPTREEIEKLARDANNSCPTDFLKVAQMSYFGGWFEIMMHGHIPGVTYEYDINSAYPAIIANLPCLLHGRYTKGVGIPDVRATDICLVKADIWGSIRGKKYIGPMLHRRPDGRILRPIASSGWYYWHELQAAQACGLLGKHVIHEWLKYEPCDCPPPARKIANLYQKRLEYGKNTARGKANKLVYNSAYGKFAQSIGNPIYANPIYASLITAGCRTMILNAIATHPNGMKAVAMIATDGVYFLEQHPGLTLGKELGQWSMEEKHNLTLFKPGVYWDDKAREDIAAGDKPRFKARGFKASDFKTQLQIVDDAFTKFYDGWRSRPKQHIDLSMLLDRASFPIGRWPGWPEVTFKPTFAMVTCLQALRRNDWNTAGLVTTEKDSKEVIQSSNPIEKRYNPYMDTYHDGRILYRSKPHDNDDLMPSTPYDKKFGMEDPANPFSQESMEKYGITPDGPIPLRIVDMIIPDREERWVTVS